MIVMNRFRLVDDDATLLREPLQEALAVLSRQPGFLEGHVGRSVDDPALWLLQTRWAGPGAYRRALSAYEVKLRAWAVLGQALDEPGAYEVVVPGDRLNEVLPRENP
jgi:quinol monooxygenase YgiN